MNVSSPTSHARRALVENLGALGVAKPSEDTLEHLDKHAPWFPGLVEEAAANRSSAAPREQAQRIHMVLRAASRVTREALRKGGVDPSFPEILTVANTVPDFFARVRQVQEGRGDAARLLGSLFGRSAAHPREPTNYDVETARQASRSLDGGPEEATSSQPEVDPSTLRRVLGPKAALTVARTGQSTGGLPALSVEMASALGQGQYDWERRLSLQLGATESTLFFAVLCGIAPAFQTKSASRGVSLQVVDRGHRFEVRLSQRGQAQSVALGPIDALHIALLVSDAILEVHPQLRDMAGLVAFARHFVQRMAPPV